MAMTQENTFEQEVCYSRDVRRCVRFQKNSRGRPSPSLPCLKCGLAWSVHPWVPPKEKPILEDCSESLEQDITAPALNSEHLQILAEALQKLSLDDVLFFREREILKLRYGLADGCIYSLQEISTIFGLSRERVRQIDLKTFRKLQRILRGEIVIQDINPTVPTSEAPQVSEVKIEPLTETRATEATSSPEVSGAEVKEVKTELSTEEKSPETKRRGWKKFTKQSHEYTDEELLTSSIYLGLKGSIPNWSEKDLLRLVRTNIDEYWRMNKEAQIRDYAHKIFELLGDQYLEIQLTRDGDYKISSSNTQTAPQNRRFQAIASGRKNKCWMDKPAVQSNGQPTIKRRS
jgi:RNA polymerase sigma factor (sigma-70 family)